MAFPIVWSFGEHIVTGIHGGAKPLYSVRSWAGAGAGEGGRKREDLAVTTPFGESSFQ